MPINQAARSRIERLGQPMARDDGGTTRAPSTDVLASDAAGPCTAIHTVPPAPPTEAVTRSGDAGTEGVALAAPDCQPAGTGTWSAGSNSARGARSSRLAKARLHSP